MLRNIFKNYYINFYKKRFYSNYLVEKNPLDLKEEFNNESTFENKNKSVDTDLEEYAAEFVPSLDYNLEKYEDKKYDDDN